MKEPKQTKDFPSVIAARKTVQGQINHYHELMKESQHLYNPADVKKVREVLLKEQDGKDLVTGLPLDLSNSVTDHSHQTHYVRGIIHRQINSFVGKLENNYIRMIKWWYNGTLPDLLRQIADYLDRPDDLRYIHTGWLKACGTKFNALSEGQKKEVLKSLARPEGANAKERKEIFRKALLSRQFTLTQIEYIIQQVKT